MTRDDIYKEKLVLELRMGNPSAFKAVYDMYVARLFSFAFSLTKSREDASDLVQEVFVRLWENRQNISADKSIEAFLFAIGRNLFVSAYRKQMTEQRYVDYAEYIDSMRAAGTASFAIEYDEYRKAFEQVFASLPERQRQIVRLSKFEGKKNVEIAAILDLSEQTVKNQLSLGLKELKRLMAKLPLSLAVFANFAYFMAVQFPS